MGVITNVNQMIDGRVSGVRITQNTGEPGSGQQIRIRGGNSISASSEPLYVIDGIAMSNVPTEANGVDLQSGTLVPPPQPAEHSSTPPISRRSPF